jgi:hypothetical protein
MVGLPAALGGCAHAPAAEPDAGRGPSSRPVDDVRARPASVTLGDRSAAPDELGPAILLPKEPASDDVVATIGEQRIHKSQVFDRLVETSRRDARLLVDLLVMDAVVAAKARQHGIAVDGERVRALVDREEQQLRAQVALEWGGVSTFEQYLQKQFDMGVEQYRTFLQVELARERYRGLVIRFLAMLEDRVEIRFAVHRDRAVIEDIRRRVQEGADFATLAMRHSEDETRRDGGLMPPFGRGFDHPIAHVAFDLEPGGLSEIVQFEQGGAVRHGLVYCLRRMPKREVAFQDVRADIQKDLDARPVTSFEQKAFALRWCTEPLNTATTTR